MFDTLLAVFGSNGIHRVGMIITIASQIVKTLEQEFGEEKEGKNAAIDTMIELLNKHKSV